MADNEKLAAIRAFLDRAEGKLYPTPDKPESDWGLLQVAKEELAALDSTPPTDGLVTELAAMLVEGHHYSQEEIGAWVCDNSEAVLTALSQQRLDPATVEAWLSSEIDQAINECKKAEQEDDRAFWRRYWAGYGKGLAGFRDKLRALKKAGSHD